jgi:SrtB family sortase
VKNKIKFLWIIFGVSVVATAFFGIKIAREFNENRQGQVFYAALPVVFLQISDEETEIEEEIFFEPMIDLVAVRENFPNIVGWIKSEGAGINYPIVQAADNDFYLRHLPDGTRHAWGSIFLDYRNAADFSDASVFIYGHNIRTGDMFGLLKNFREQIFFENNSHMFIFTPAKNFSLQIFAAYVLNSAFEVPPMQFADASEFDEFIANARARSFIQSDSEILFGDTLIFLCTCTNAGASNERLIILGKLAETYLI